MYDLFLSIRGIFGLAIVVDKSFRIGDLCITSYKCWSIDLASVKHP